MNRQSQQAATFFSALFILLAAGLLSAPPSRAQQPQAPATATTRGPTQSPANAPTANGQVQGYTLTPGQEAQAVAYAHARHELYFLDVAYGLLLLVLILQLRVAPAYRNLATKWTDSSFGQIFFFTPLLFVTTDVLGLPTALWEHRLALQYQQSIQGWGSWLTDWAKGEGVEMAIAILLVWAGLVEAFVSQYHEPVVPYGLKIAFGLIEALLLTTFLARSGAPREARDAG